MGRNPGNHCRQHQYRRQFRPAWRGFYFCYAPSFPCTKSRSHAGLQKNPPLRIIASDLATTARAPTSATQVDQLPFSQLHADDIASFITAHIAPHVKFPLSDIEDIFPVTDFQAGCIKAAVQQKPPSFWNYFYLDLPSSRVATGVLSAACRAIALHFSILRTVIVPFDGGFVQIVTKDWVPEFVQVNSTIGDIAASTERIAGEYWMDVEVKTGTCFARFMIILADDEPKRSRLVIRMSHALTMESVSAPYFRPYQQLLKGDNCLLVGPSRHLFGTQCQSDTRFLGIGVNSWLDRQ